MHADSTTNSSLKEHSQEDAAQIVPVSALTCTGSFFTLFLQKRAICPVSPHSLHFAVVFLERDTFFPLLDEEAAIAFVALYSDLSTSLCDFISSLSRPDTYSQVDLWDSLS